MRDHESTDLEGAAFLARAEEHYLDMTYENLSYEYDHDYEDDPFYAERFRSAPTEEDELFAILNRIAMIGVNFPVMPHSFLSDFDPADIPF